MLNQVTSQLANEDETVAFGSKLATLLSKTLGRVENRALCINLEGDLGAGKTTLTRGFLRAWGYKGTVKSPTYTIVESYKVDGVDAEVLHFDLYRLADPEELELMGIRDYFAKHAVILIEWPDRGDGILPKPDLIVSLTHQEDGRTLKITSEFFTEDELKTLI